jgi:bifunctional DNA-binding transcriptional regulator/antitoxin component of YhaV-PrlF toxin-antitoxin module
MKLRKVGSRYVVTIPQKEVKRLGLKEGDLLAVQVQRAEARHVLSKELQEAFERSWERSKEGYMYLAKK